jgi:hypothetical protein
MTESIRSLSWRFSLAATVIAAALGAFIVVTVFSGDYLYFSLPIVERIYGSQESVPMAYDRGLRICFLCAAVTIGGIIGMIIMRNKKFEQRASTQPSVAKAPSGE